MSVLLLSIAHSTCLMPKAIPLPLCFLVQLLGHLGLWCYTHETGEVWVGNNIAFRRQFHNRDSCVLEGLGAVCCGNVIPVDRACVWSLFFGWLLIPWTSPEEVSCHGVKPDTSTAAHTVLLTSPVHETMKVIVKEGADVLYMPLWELEELLDCRSKMYDMVPEVTVKGLFGYYGGMARYVLQHPSLDPDREVLELLRPLRTAIDTCNVKQTESPCVTAADAGSVTSSCQEPHATNFQHTNVIETYQGR
ncbi:hypothetical protein VOLCADRAFT_100742 [Volvox carteri f. nagariensis]|uniref:Uncharacterized protein n=1 Tax=Volvox carteri f. nagariensis TaxID=3068 RepID=D8UKX3_VOLCA|nr:uncharacterized protein VOLCADRAFT_100742 [Volvox carteri f. nagariensis]EFJ39625.1 hypothetical protein VOLCADRAFT_100742 [Volvox carteri f. nagariensis]|eukprot:XP_002959309.1 hypothetical protein VOLCADRAFT_100742 [Volvox carteri f. nagariensis]